MLFHAMMEFCLDLLRSKFWLIGEWSIGFAFLYTFFIEKRTGSSRLFGGTKNINNMSNMASTCRKFSYIPKVICAA